MIKLFERIFWHNNTTPAINEDNLNAMSKAIDDIDNRVIDLGADVMEVVPQIQAYLDQAADLVEAMELLTKNPPYIGANGNWYVWDTDTSSFVDSGIDASITVQIADVTMLAYGTAPYITNSGTSTDPVFHLFIPRAAGITSITKTGTSGLVDTYTVTFQDGNTSTFQVTNGKGIVSIAKTSTSGLVDTYTITFNDSTTTTFTVTNGNGDMNKSTYDPQSAVENAGGISNYVSGAVSSLKSAFANNVSFADAKNLYSFDTYTQSSNGVLFTVNDDLTITTANTSGNGNIVFLVGTVAKGLTKAHLSGCPSGGSHDTYALQLRDMTTYDFLAEEVGAGRDYTLDATHKYNIYIIVRASQNMNGKIFKPMITLDTTPDSDYDHYVAPSKTNHQLTEDSVTWDDYSNSGAVNVIPFSLDSIKADTSNSSGTWSGNVYTYNGITFTVNDDGSVIVNGTSTARATLTYYRAPADQWLQKNRAYKATTYNKNFIDGTQGFLVQLYREGNPWPQINAFNEKAFIVADQYFGISTKVNIQIVVENGITVTNQTIKPLIADAVYNGSYVPYAKTNKELTDYTDRLNSNINSVKGGTLDIENISMTANVEQEIISSEGMYLLFIDSSVAERCCGYMVHVHYSDTNGSIQVPIYVGNDITITFDKSVAKKLKMTASRNCRVRKIKLSTANY